MSAARNEPWLRPLLEQWRRDPGATYLAWFLWEERLKNFRSIRRGVEAVVEEIEADRFGNVYKGSSLETVVGSIAEQRQIFNRRSPFGYSGTKEGNISIHEAQTRHSRRGSRVIRI